MKNDCESVRRRTRIHHGVMTAAMVLALSGPFSAAMAAPAVAAPYVVPLPHLMLVADNKAAEAHAGEVDPVVTGKTVDAGQRAEWERKRKRFLECGLCGGEQAFPEDLAGGL